MIGRGFLCPSYDDLRFELPDLFIVLRPHLAHHLPHILDGFLEGLSLPPLLLELRKLEELRQLLQLIEKNFFPFSLSLHLWLILLPIIPGRLVNLFDVYQG